MTTFDRLIDGLNALPKQRLAVAGAADDDVLNAVLTCRDLGIVSPLLVGQPPAIEEQAERLSRPLDDCRLIAAETAEEAAKTAVALVREKQADAVMKGFVSTAELLRAILDRTDGIRGPRRLSHVGVFTLPALDRPLFVTDAAVNVAPDFDSLIDIVLNAVAVAQALGVIRPRIGCLSAIEKASEQIPSSLQADRLVRHFANQEQGFDVGGPYALDNALFRELAEKKGLADDPLAGRSDILLVPGIDSGNLLYKAMMLLTAGQGAGLVVGARAPVVLTSRSDSDETKRNSIVLALVVSQNQKEKSV